MAADSTLTELIETARRWIAGDPDPPTRAELEELIAADERSELAARFSDPLTFGTAGIRGRVGAGPSRMNRAVVIRTTAGLASYLGAPERPLVLGFDARPDSRRFAEDAAGVLDAAGFTVMFFPEVTPTPLVAFAAKHLGACAAIVITASHNPPSDNGYKVYGSNAAQIIPPVDTDISDAIDGIGPANEVPRTEAAFTRGSGVQLVPSNIFDLYYQMVDGARPDPTPSHLKIVYTPMHGVGGATLTEMMRRAGHEGFVVVPEQAEPDGSFPTMSFPNPEEEGAMDLCIDLAIREGASLVIANDPDADRLAAALPIGGRFRMLTGNDLGALLGDYLLRGYRGTERPIVVNSVVSSPMLSRIAEQAGARHEVTLTGFKWIVNAGLALQEQGEGRFLFGYEEALGYSLDDVVRDKDGMSAALLFCDLVAGLAIEGATVWDRLGELWTQVGVWASAQRSIVVTGPDGVERIRDAVDEFAVSSPSLLSNREVTAMIDYRKGVEHRPVWLGAQDLVELELGSSGRVLVRPSGTEPKLKVYADLVEPAGSDVLVQKQRLTELARVTAGETASLLSL